MFIGQMHFTIIYITTFFLNANGLGIHAILSKFNNFIDLIDNTTTPHQYYHNNPQKFDEYDFIIIGSGSAGSIIANRLSEISDWKILLLEAGNRGNILTQVPLLAPLFQLTPFNWNYKMERQEGICNGMVDNLCAWPRGKALGGSTVLNYLIYTRGNPLDYQKWLEHGNPGWSYDDVLPYYLKSENCRLGIERCNNEFHNTKGYLSVEPPFSTELTNAFLQSGIELGERVVDYNSPDYMGFSKIQANLKHGRRHSVVSAFLDPVISRPNLHIITFARVSKILIDPQTKRAFGVEYFKRKRKFVVKTRKEVILSAGAFHSPQLLMLSGIGPKNHLEELRIPVIKNLPVGQSLYDHISYLGLAFKINRTIVPKTAFLQPNEFLNFIVNGKGVYTSLGGIEALAYINTNTTHNSSNYPDIELIFSGVGSLESDYGQVAARELRIKQEIYDSVYKPIENVPCWSIIPMLLHPKSKGFLKLRSNNPFDPPKLFGNFYTDRNRDDIRTMIASIRFIQKLAKTKAFQKFGSNLHDISIPGCEKLEYDSDDYWECALRSLSGTLHHQVATCKMGSWNDPEAVVNSELKVYGVKNLRVADTSVIPVTLSAHTSAPSMMIGEKVSDLIKTQWLKQPTI